MEFSSPRKPKRSFGKTLLYLILGAGLLLVVTSIVSSLFRDDGMGGGSEAIALVEVRGMITESQEVVRQLAKYRDADHIRGIVVRIDSPGGGVAPSQEIYDAVLRVKASQKKIYASMGSVAASGGYYIASAADTIFANPGTLTGSIGVIMAFSNVEELIEKVGIRPEVIKSGKFKDAGSPVKPLSKEDRELLQRLVDDVQEQFIEAVSEGRQMPPEDVQKVADGRVFTGRQALEMNMVDRLGGLQDSIEHLAEQVGIQGTPKVVQETEKVHLLDWLMQAAFYRELKSSFTAERIPSLQFLWTVP